MEDSAVNREAGRSRALFRRGRTLGVAAVTVATLAGILAAPAEADVASVRSTCEGEGVVRCILLRYDDSSLKIAARGVVFDVVTDNYNYEVAVSNVRVQRWTSNGWVNFTNVNDYDGWWPSNDEATSPFRSCALWVKYRAVGKFKWKRSGNVGSYSLATKSWSLCRR